MSTIGVRTRFVRLLAQTEGRVTEEAFASLLAYARERGLASGEVKALLRPADYLETSKILKSRGVRLQDVRFDEGAWDAATALAREHGIAAPLARLPNANPRAARVPAAAPEHPPSLAALMQRGKPLGHARQWLVETPGARITFAAEVQDTWFPAVVMEAPAWSDPAQRDIVADHRAELRAVSTLAGVVKTIRRIVDENRTYFAAEGVTARSANERHGIQDLRRAAFFEALRTELEGSHLDPGEQSRLGGTLLSEKEHLLCDRDYQMEVGTQRRYWPYWDNFLSPLRKLVEQTAAGSDEQLVLRNRVDEILNRKTVTGYARQIDERDLEATAGMALVHRPLYSGGDGHRVSLTADSYPMAPAYEVLSVMRTGLREELARHAGAPVYRDVDGTLRFDPSGDKLPEALARHLQARKVPLEEVGLRLLAAGETPRKGFPGDWNRDGAVAFVPTEIGWWGHCHNEAPLNALVIDPKRGVEWYRADRRLAPEQARRSYTAQEVWDAFGALVDDHDRGYVNRGSYGFRATEVDVSKFVGSRNDGGHWLLLEMGRPGARRVRIDAEVTDLWHKSDPSKKYADPALRFRRDLPEDDGSFAPNPDWVAADVGDEDEITIDALRRRLIFKLTFVSFDSHGARYEAKETIQLDPQKSGAVKLADEIVQTSGRLGGRLIEHWYDPKAATYHSVTVEVREADGYQRKAGERTDPVPVRAFWARQETAYDSVIDLHDFITKNIGLPFTCDTVSGLAVWNYPVKKVRIDREREVEKIESAGRFVYTTYRLSLETMGGPSPSARYVVKRDGQANAPRALALDPMIDFAWRNERWACAPAVADASGDPAYNASALEGGYLTNKARDRIVPELWRRLGLLVYASFAAPGTEDMAYVFEATDGSFVAFPDRASFEAAVAADGAAPTSVVA